MLPAAALLVGTVILAVALVLQVRFVAPEFWPLAKYNVLILPFMLASNILLGYGYVSATRAGWYLPLVVACQIFLYQIVVFILSCLLLGGHHVGLPQAARAVLAFMMIAGGVALLSK
ncbi:hypothetical protein SAMN00808754_1432 [Thermanaeromonas toyohensis ToBE]|uniref:EamA-like transporter family protein n=1 Tax=Thermanaeromonas toyohensis ToBE TaxID=698762 RepID=A0A1W1VSB1_9FIRM|nr:hypothetical protein [Thermanaeromonas toyohensis]SMB96238.1 hypothetical protein SAMN00808754_1432 [Thermanaeromonas toyohensis ToBE]